jgi:glycerophosphoryl diester phosphodiesterase
MKRLIAPISITVTLIVFLVVGCKEFNRHDNAVVQTVQSESPATDRKPAVSVPETKPEEMGNPAAVPVVTVEEAEKLNKDAKDYTAREKEEYLFGIIGDMYRGIKLRNVTLTGKSTQRYTLTTRSPFPQIVRCRAKCTGGNAAITFQNGLYSSPVYNISYGSEYEIHSWRIPPALSQDTTTITITVGADVTVAIDYLFSEEAVYNPTVADARPIFCSHLGFRQLCPENTRPAVEMAGLLGYPVCIVVPKATSDGVLVCIHDDTINATARDAEGNPPSTKMGVSDMTYAQLLEWDFGRYKNAYWTGTKILTVDDFFAICARYGMSPMFSTHPALTTEQWQSVKSMLMKHGLLKKFHVKAFDESILQTAFDVFGEEIEGYTGEHGDSYVTLPELTEFVQRNNIDLTKTRIVSEKSINTIDSAYVASVLAVGFQCGCYTITSSKNAVSLKELMEYGVTSFTDDSYCQNGMDW